MQRKRIGSVGDDLTSDTALIVALLAGAYFLVVKPIMNDFGASDADKQTVSDQVNLDPNENPFSPSFQAYVDNSNAYNSSNGFASNASRITQANQIWQNDGSPTQLTGDGTGLDLVIAAEAIYSSIGWLVQDWNTVNAMFSSITCQINIAYIANYIQVIYTKDLFSLLQKGQWSIFGVDGGMSTTALAALVNHVNDLPVTC